MKCDLQRYFGEMASALPVGEKQKSTYSAKSFPEIPERLETDQLVITKGHHDYEGASRVDKLEIFAQKATYQELGLLVLSVVFRPGGARIQLALTNPASAVKNLIIEYSGLTPRASGHRTRPDYFLFYPGRVDTHPWVYQNLEPFSLPTFKLTNLKEFTVTDEDWARRDTVMGFGNDDASVRLAGLFLNIGSPQNEKTEVVLESEGGFRGVGIHSAEASFYLPGSPAWPPSPSSEHS
jgi:hypothetical protein